MDFHWNVKTNSDYVLEHYHKIFLPIPRAPFQEHELLLINKELDRIIEQCEMIKKSITRSKEKALESTKNKDAV
jgi:hypothetical protein